MLLVSEELGVGLGARFAGLDGPDPGDGFAAGPPHALRPVRPPRVPALARGGARPGRVRRRGDGHLAVAVLWPDTAGVLLVEPLTLRDLRDPGQELDLPFGAPSPRLPG